MPAIQVLVPGFDPTSVAQPTAAQLLQMVQAAVFAGTIGGVIEGATAPDVVADPTLERYIYFRLDVDGNRTGEVFYWDGSAWVTLLTYDGSLFADGSIPLAKLSGTGQADGNVMVYNLTGSTWEGLSLAQLFATYDIPITAIPVGTNGQFLRTTGGVVAWGGLVQADLNGLTVTPAQISGAADGQILIRLSGTNQWWTPDPTVMFDPGSITVNLLNVGSAPDGYHLVVQGGVATWVSNTSVTVEKWSSAAINLSAISNPYTHDLGDYPGVWTAKLKCTSTDAGYAVGDMIDANVVFGSTSSGDNEAYASLLTLAWTAADVSVTLVSYTTRTVPAKTTGIQTAFDVANWQLIITGYL